MYVCKVNYLCICAEPHTHTYSSNSFVLQLYVFLLHIICMYVCMYARAPWIKDVWFFGSSYVIPNVDSVVLGGTT